jgi:hypothetical protein
MMAAKSLIPLTAPLVSNGANHGTAGFFQKCGFDGRTDAKTPYFTGFFCAIKQNPMAHQWRTTVCAIVKKRLGKCNGAMGAPLTLFQRRFNGAWRKMIQQHFSKWRLRWR